MSGNADHKSNTYLMDGVAALDRASVAVPTADGSSGRKDGEGEDGDGSNASEHSECRRLG